MGLWSKKKSLMQSAIVLWSNKKGLFSEGYVDGAGVLIDQED